MTDDPSGIRYAVTDVNSTGQADGKAHRAWRGMLPGDVVPARYGALIYDRAGHSSRVHWQEKPALKEMPLQSISVCLARFTS